MTWIEIPGVQQPANGLARINDLSCVGDTWWAVSSVGVVWSWREGASAHSAAALAGQLRTIAMAPTGEVGWLGRLGPVGLLARTEDGGASWRDEELPTKVRLPHSICALEALSERNVWAAGAFFDREGVPPQLLHFDGEQWHNVALPEEKDQTLRALTDIWFFDAEGDAPPRGVVAGGKGQVIDRTDVGPAIFFTEDGGSSWQAATLPRELPRKSYCWKLHFNDARVGFASLEGGRDGEAGALLKTHNGGRDWELLTVERTSMIIGSISNLQAVAFAPWDENLGWICARQQGLLTTHDGGRSWSQSSVPWNVNRILVVGQDVVAGGKELHRFTRGPSKIPA